MKKVLCLMLVLCLALPAMAMAAKGKKISRATKVFAAPDTLTAEQKQVFEGKGRVKMGKEFVYVSKDLTQASLSKDATCTEKRQIHYVCCDCRNVIKTRPGRCPCGKDLMPAFKTDNARYLLERNEIGKLVIKPCPAMSGAPAGCCGGTKADCPSCGACAPKTEVPPAAPAAEPTPADCGSCGK